MCPIPVSTALGIRLTKSRALSHRNPTEHHLFLPSGGSILDEAVLADRIHGSRQITDVYLLSLATAHGCRLVTFDRAVPLSAVSGGISEHLLTL